MCSKIYTVHHTDKTELRRHSLTVLGKKKLFLLDLTYSVMKLGIIFTEGDPLMCVLVESTNVISKSSCGFGCCNSIFRDDEVSTKAARVGWPCSSGLKVTGSLHDVSFSSLFSNVLFVFYISKV